MIRFCCRSFFLLAVFTSFLTACESREERMAKDANRVLDARKKAMETADVAAYEKLISPDYKDEIGDRASLMEMIRKTFEGVSKVELTVLRRDVQIRGEEIFAEQDFKATMFSDKNQFKVKGAERLILHRKNGQWMIVGGLRDRQPDD